MKQKTGAAKPPWCKKKIPPPDTCDRVFVQIPNAPGRLNKNGKSQSFPRLFTKNRSGCWKKVPHPRLQQRLGKQTLLVKKFPSQLRTKRASLGASGKSGKKWERREYHGDIIKTKMQARVHWNAHRPGVQWQSPAWFCAGHFSAKRDALREPDLPD